MKILIAYASKTGNTKEFAEKIYEKLRKKHEIKLHNISLYQKINIDEYNLVLIGTWIHRNTAIKPVANFLKQIKNKNIILFATMGAMPSSEYGIKTLENLKKIPYATNKILDIIILPGEVDKKMISQIKLIPSFILPKKIKETMIEISNNSRKANQKEFEIALNQIENVLLNINSF